MSVGKLKILLVIPVYNHGSTLVEVTDKALSTGYPVLVVDDGSSDGGWRGLAGLQCQLHRLPCNMGKGAAILAGARLAMEQGFDAIISLDADGQHDPGEVRLLAGEAESGGWPTIVIGARQMVQETVPGSSLWGRSFSNFWVRLESGVDLDDTQSGMRLYPVKELLSLKLTKTRYDFEVEVLVKALWSGVFVRSVPVSVYYPPRHERVSHFHKIRDNWRLTRLHTALVCRRLLPIPHRKVVELKGTKKDTVVVKNPFKTLKNLCRENASPLWLAVAVWLGIVLGALPLLACHTVVIIYVAHKLHLNKVAAVAASQLCMPPLLPVLCIEVGYFLRKGKLIVDLSWEKWLLEIHVRLLDWFIGSLLVGPLLGLAGAGLVYWLGRRMNKNIVNPCP